MEKDPVKQKSLHDEYKKLRNEITKDKRDSKKAYYITYFEKNKHKSSKIWKGIRTLVNIKPSKSANIKLFDENNNLVSDPIFQHVTEPTRYRENERPNLLDLVLSSEEGMVQDLRYLPPLGK